MARKVTRASRKTKLLHAASRVVVPDTCDVCVIGGGAAGLVASIIAAEQGARVVALERDLECGRTILATGNGRCNFANRHADPVLYNDPAFVCGVCGATWLADVLAFFESCGLAWAEEAEGRLYPLSRQAASVRNVLLRRAQAAEVMLSPARDVMRVHRKDGGFDITFREQWGDKAATIQRAKAVIVSVGGTATTVCEGLGLESAPTIPLLCPLSCTGPALPRLDGRRVRAYARLERDGGLVTEQCGEVLFREYGLSGIVVFNLSRFAQPGDTITLDLIPTLALEQAQRLGACTLDGLLDPIVAQALIEESGSASAALTLAKALTYTVTSTAEVGHAQVHRGGLTTSQFEPQTLQARNVPGLFACGEALNVDGPCGGYNLAWAWKSGMIAGVAAAKEVCQRD